MKLLSEFGLEVRTEFPIASKAALNILLATFALFLHAGHTQH